MVLYKLYLYNTNYTYQDPVDSYLLTHAFQKAIETDINITDIIMINELNNHGFIISNIRFSTGIDIINPNGNKNISINLIADGYIFIGYFV